MSLSTDLEMARLETRAKFPALEVVVQDGSVYINFAFNEAVVIFQEYLPQGRVWFAELFRWAPDHGVEEELHLEDDMNLTYLLEQVDVWLRARIEQDEKTQAIIDSMPEDL